MSKKQKVRKSTLAESKYVIGLGVAAILLSAGMFYLARHRSYGVEIPIYFNRAEDAMPFPQTLDPLRFQADAMREAYSVAKETPDVLVQQPCYCFCQRQGHRSLLDCFRSTHGSMCDICMNEARLAGQLHQRGKTAQEIRAVIVQTQGNNAGVP